MELGMINNNNEQEQDYYNQIMEAKNNLFEFSRRLREFADESEKLHGEIELTWLNMISDPLSREELEALLLQVESTIGNSFYFTGEDGSPKKIIKLSKIIEERLKEIKNNNAGKIMPPKEQQTSIPRTEPMDRPLFDMKDYQIERSFDRIQRGLDEKLESMAKKNNNKIEVAFDRIGASLNSAIESISTKIEIGQAVTQSKVETAQAITQSKIETAQAITQSKIDLFSKTADDANKQSITAITHNQSLIKGIVSGLVALGVAFCSLSVAAFLYLVQLQETINIGQQEQQKEVNLKISDLRKEVSFEIKEMKKEILDAIQKKDNSKK